MSFWTASGALSRIYVLPGIPMFISRLTSSHLVSRFALASLAHLLRPYANNDINDHALHICDPGAMCYTLYTSTP